MFDIEALEGAGFAKKYTTEEWQQLQAATDERSSRMAAATAGGVPRAGGQVKIDYVLERGNVRIITEQNTQEQAPFGISTTVRYPEIAIIESTVDMRRVSCDASDTALILTLADQVEADPAPRPGPNSSRRP